MSDFKLEVVVLPVADVDRAAGFYRRLGWRVDADIATPGGGRILQFTPPGSPASVLIGTGLTPSAALDRLGHRGRAGRTGGQGR